jgi:hypothetical protein
MKHLRLIAFGLLSLGLLMGGINGALSFKTRAFAQGASLPKVNVPFFSGEVPFPQMAIFWFGRITPTENFVDVRVGYNPQHIYIYVAVIDRLLWYDTTPSADDLTNWDAVTLYLSVAEANTIGPHAYRFVAQFNAFTDNTADYQQAYRGTGTGWTPFSINFTAEAGWRGNAPNNDEDTDRGWAMNFYIPFASLGLSGPPALQTRWRLAVVVHDRDDPQGTPIPDKIWPPTFSSTNPLTWGILSFGLPTYTPPTATPGGTVIIRDKLNGLSCPTPASAAQPPTSAPAMKNTFGTNGAMITSAMNRTSIFKISPTSPIGRVSLNTISRSRWIRSPQEKLSSPRRSSSISLGIQEGPERLGHRSSKSSP